MGRSLPTVFRQFLLENFQGRRVHINEMRKAVKRKYATLCDDNKLCKHETPPHRPEWDHKLRQVLDYLSNKAKGRNRISHPKQEPYEFP